MPPPILGPAIEIRPTRTRVLDFADDGRQLGRRRGHKRFFRLMSVICQPRQLRVNRVGNGNLANFGSGVGRRSDIPVIGLLSSLSSFKSRHGDLPRRRGRGSSGGSSEGSASQQSSGQHIAARNGIGTDGIRP